MKSASVRPSWCATSRPVRNSASIGRRAATGERHCAFCGRPRGEVRKLVAGPGVHICDRCISVCRQLLSEERKQTPAPKQRLPQPRELCEQLDEWVVGQTRAKRVLT